MMMTTLMSLLPLNLEATSPKPNPEPNRLGQNGQGGLGLTCGPDYGDVLVSDGMLALVLLLVLVLVLGS